MYRNGGVNLFIYLFIYFFARQLRVAYMGENTLLVSLTCNKRTDTMVKLCEVFESLGLKIITANITTVSGRVLKTVFIEVSLFN
jgi:UTP:GlnB (protein PII) uridylyltransferase